MSIDFVEEMGLKHFGFSDAQIAQIDASIPKFQYVVNLVMNNRTVLKELFDVVTMVTNQIAHHQREQT